jgi:hypothetical protein
MPTISVFYGIVIQMFWRDHAPTWLLDLSPKKLAGARLVFSLARSRGCFGCAVLTAFYFLGGTVFVANLIVLAIRRETLVLGEQTT